MQNTTDNKDNTMGSWGFKSTLINTLEELEITRNALAVESKIRPLTINELSSGKAKQINFVTLSKIMETLNKIAAEKGLNRIYSVSDIFEYHPNNEKPTDK